MWNAITSTSLIPNVVFISGFQGVVAHALITRLYYVHYILNRGVMTEQSRDFGDLARGLALLHEALGPTANIQTAGSRSLHPPDLPLTLFLRTQRQAHVSLVFPQNLEAKKISTSTSLVVVGRRFPSQVTARWRKAAQSFIDLRGEVFLEVPGLLIDKKVKPRKDQRRPELATADPFTDLASKITRWLLENPPGIACGVRQLANVTKVSLGTASKIVRVLEARELIVVSRIGRKATITVENPRALFTAWASVYDWSQNVSLRVHAPIADPKAFLSTLPKKFTMLSERWALTMHAGASTVVQHAVSRQTHIYVENTNADSLEAIAAQLNWVPDAEGGLTLMRPYYRKSLWSGITRTKGLPVVSPLQLALDLWNYPVRGREEAIQVLRKTLPWIADGKAASRQPAE